MNEQKPPSPVGAAKWRNRFVAINMVRIGGTLIVLLGLVIWHSDRFREGGWPEVGLPMALLGLLISFGGTRLLVQRWRTPPEE
jgi:hypothetical protein